MPMSQSLSLYYLTNKNSPTQLTYKRNSLVRELIYILNMRLFLLQSKALGIY
jgi:hypothetical protein